MCIICRFSGMLIFVNAIYGIFDWHVAVKIKIILELANSMRYFKYLR